jgi:C-terminal processing protease CtpA/Prc
MSIGDALDGQPLVALADGGSASGSEIVAARCVITVRDVAGRAQLRQGFVQTVIPLLTAGAEAHDLALLHAFRSIHERDRPDIAIGPTAATGGRAGRADEDVAVLRPSSTQHRGLALRRGRRQPQQR